MKHWWTAARPKTLTAIIAPVVMAGALSRDSFHLGSWLLCLLFGLSIQIATNLSNDYFDYVKGSDNDKRKGPTRVCQAELIEPTVVRTAAFGTFGLALLTSVILSVWGGAWIILLGAVSVALGLLYTAGPYALAYLGLGDIFVLFFFGPVALGGTHAIVTGVFSPSVWLLGFAPGFLSMALLTVNNARDIEEDRAAGKRTLAVRFGARFARFEYYLSVGAAFAIPLYFVYAERLPAGALAPLALLPFALYLCHRISRGWNFNQILAQTGMMLGLFAVLFAAGVVWS